MCCLHLCCLRSLLHVLSATVLYALSAGWRCLLHVCSAGAVLPGLAEVDSLLYLLQLRELRRQQHCLKLQQVLLAGAIQAGCGLPQIGMSADYLLLSAVCLLINYCQLLQMLLSASAVSVADVAVC